MIGTAKQAALTLGSPDHLDGEIPSPRSRLMQVPPLRHLVETSHHLRPTQTDGLIWLQGLDLGGDRFVNR